MIVEIQNFGQRVLIDSMTDSQTTIPLKASDLSFILSSLSDGESVALDIIGSIYSESILVSRSSGALTVERGQMGDQPMAFQTGDCVVAVSQSEDSEECEFSCSITTQTPDEIRISGDCDSGISIDFVGDRELSRECSNRSRASLSSSDRVLLDGCRYFTIQDLCDEIMSCIDISSLVGPAGRDGVDGSNGSNGTNGTNGANGRDGRDGVDGVDGMDGRDGVDGQNGSDGSDGEDGSNGADGDGGGGRIDGFAHWVGNSDNTNVNSTGVLAEPDDITPQLLRYNFGGLELSSSNYLLRITDTDGNVLSPVVSGRNTSGFTIDTSTLPAGTDRFSVILCL